MKVPVEMQLMAMAVALYVYDASLLLHANEGVLTPGRKGTWRLLLGVGNLSLREKDLLVLPLLLLHRPVFRGAWNDEEGKLAKADEEGLRQARDRYSGLAPFVYGVAVALFVLLPFTLFFFLTDLSLAVTLAYLYANILAALAWVQVKRKALGLGRKEVLSLWFECLVCPPLAANLVRRLSLKVPVRGDVVELARGLLPPAGWDAAREKIVVRLDEQIAWEDEGSKRLGRLQARRDSLARQEEGAT